MIEDDFWEHEAFIIGGLADKITIEAAPGKVFFYGPGASGLTPEHARRAASALLSAARYAERTTND